MKQANVKRSKKSQKQVSPDVARMMQLPFIKDIKTRSTTNRCFWAVEPTIDYDAAFETGLEYGAAYLKFLHAEKGFRFPHLALLPMEMEREGALLPAIGDGRHGYAAGFFTFLEFALRSATDVDAFEQLAKYRAIRAPALPNF